MWDEKGCGFEKWIRRDDKPRRTFGKALNSAAK
jgi:hypothetical protein